MSRQGLRVRDGQMEQLREVTILAFAERLHEHLLGCFPAECGKLGEQQTKALIRYGIQRAGAHALTTERDICKYLNLMMVFGRDFDRRPELAWMAETLDGKGPLDSSQRLQSVYAMAVEMLNAGEAEEQYRGRGRPR